MCCLYYIVYCDRGANIRERKSQVRNFHLSRIPDEERGAGREYLASGFLERPNRFPKVGVMDIVKALRLVIVTFFAGRKGKQAFQSFSTPVRSNWLGKYWPVLSLLPGKSFGVFLRISSR